LLMTRGALTTFSIANDVAKYFAIVPALFAGTLPWLKAIDVMRYRPLGADALLRRNLLIWGLGGVIVPFIGIKLIDVIMVTLKLVA
jgi:potassium-transporting ATPase ATP-binding subunit